MHFYRLKRRLMTFMEMMVVLAIISLIGGVVAINIQKAMFEQRFRTEVATVVNQLRLAQNLMLILDQDVSVKFKQQDNKTIDFWLEMQCPKDKGWDKELMRRPPPLKTVGVVDFESDEHVESREVGQLEIRFMSGGTVMSRGVLRLSTSVEANNKNALERFVCLPGFPAPISAMSGKVPDISCLEDMTGQFKDQITQITIQEITSKLEAAKAAKANEVAAIKNEVQPTLPKVPAPRSPKTN
jgi:type II secretory pathway pseudopilin PulG